MCLALTDETFTDLLVGSARIPYSQGSARIQRTKTINERSPSSSPKAT